MESRDQILEGIQDDTEEGVGSWLPPPSWSGGLCAGVARGRGRLFPSSSEVTSDIEESLELMKRRKEKSNSKREVPRTL